MELPKLNKRAFALISGGLDSMIAVKVVQEQGIEIIGVHFASLFYKPRRLREKGDPAQKAADQLGIDLIMIPKDIAFLKMIQSPVYGYGAAINPCMDCRIFYLRRLKTMMTEHNVSFVITGEVLGQRPKSQMKKSLGIVEHDSGIAGRVLRPLSAQLLSPTMPEELGIVDREKLFAINGRSRSQQMDLAKKYGLHEYPNPAGGCQFTEPEFMPKVKDLFDYGYIDEDDIALLTCGKHFRITPKTKIVISKNEDQGYFLLNIAKEHDAVLEPLNFPGAVALIKGEVTADAVRIASGLIRAYSKKIPVDGMVRVKNKNDEYEYRCDIIDTAYVTETCLT